MTEAGPALGRAFVKRPVTAVTWALEKELRKAWSQTPECGSESGSLQSQLFVPVVLSVKLRILSGEMEGST